MKTIPKAKIYDRGFHFASRDAIEYVVGFRINTYIIKRGSLKPKMVNLVPLAMI
jgi:hypothetical protein